MYKVGDIIMYNNSKKDLTIATILAPIRVLDENLAHVRIDTKFAIIYINTNRIIGKLTSIGKLLYV